MPSINNNRSVLTSVYNSMQTGIEELAIKFRNKTDDLLETMLDISIDGLCDNNIKNRRYMERLMRLNIFEKDTTMDLLGTDAMPYGNSRMLDGNSVHPSYTSDRDYVTNFMQHRHEDFTRSVKLNTVTYNSYGNGNELYTSTQNLVPDELDRLEGRYSNHKWQAVNRDSILKKTKNLFDANNINTIISRFCTSEGEGGITDDTDTKSQYGMSHGRNLLLKSAENPNSVDNYDVNGYINPYCRVWTHHYQYNRLSRLIRPFVNISGERGDSEVVSVETKRKFHSWTNFKGKEEEKNAYWKNDNEGWDYSVLNDNGFVNITPKYNADQDKRIHTKQCMFSIENLAWKGYDPYSFEKALSWEQRGPMGGRIMWFPPYGIQFNETTQANWSNHTFIGRGEDVYTYTNTVRSGNLSFLMVVDHPSIIDYVSWHDGNGNEKESSVSDTDLLRFFAGCDDGVIVNAAKPTPLTDEYTEPKYEHTYTKADPVKLDPPPVEPEIPEDIKEITFYVFFPNNYSGVYDRMGEDVEAIAYLLCGSNAQKRKEDPYEDYPLKYEFNDMNNFNGNGYEMQRNITVTNEEDNKTDAIIGTRMAWRTALRKNTKTYPASSTKKWYYRIDGKYEVPSRSEVDKNTYDQTLLSPGNYKDSRSFGLNSDAKEVKKIFNEQSNEYLFSLAEVAAAISKNKQIKEYLINNKGVSKERVEILENIINNYEITNINGIGYSNSHGNNTGNINNNRNRLLAIQRIETVVDWFNSQRKDNLSGTKEVTKPDASIYVNTQNVSQEESKQWRSARMSLTLKKSTTIKQSETTQTTVNKDVSIVSNGNQKYIGYETKTSTNGKTYYEDKNGNKWIEVTDKKSSHYGELVMVEVDSNNNLTGLNEKEVSASQERSKEENKARYDQEYHFFRTLQQKDPIIFDKLMNKIQYFDPAFHSMTPEGFSARLTFLHQCTRQGNTIGASDTTNSSTPNNTASNLAFGRPPFCVLRLGDFYNQMIVIDNISINYEPLMWDLNIEGAGVIPLLANVTISFKFIGGGDMTGPVRRLQNAMTFNFYSNNSLFDNRADRMKYKVGISYSKEQGALGNEITDKSTFYNTETYDKNKNTI